MCGYPELAFKNMMQELDQKAAEPKKSKTTKKEQLVTKTSITIVYIKGMSEALSHVSAAMV